MKTSEEVKNFPFELSPKAKVLLEKYIAIHKKRVAYQKVFLKLIALRNKQSRLDQRGKKAWKDEIKELPLFAPPSNVIIFRKRRSDTLLKNKN